MNFRENGKLWVPNRYSLICSAHFIGNNRSSDQRSPSYVPSLFPDVYKRKTNNASQQDSRYQRILKRQKKSNIVLNPDDTNNSQTIQVHTNKISYTCDVSTQVGLEPINTNEFSFECNNNYIIIIIYIITIILKITMLALKLLHNIVYFLINFKTNL